MYNFRCIVLVSTVLFFTHCSPKGSPNLLPELSTCDSAVIMYYKTPGNPRFFKMAKIYDLTALATIASAANQPARIAERDCNTQGKIYCYGDKGEVFVLYFTHDAACKSLTFIKTGQKFEVDLPGKVYELLEKEKMRAYEPGSR